MTRNLKALGLALVAVFATSAVVASAASAQNGVLTSDGPVTLTGVATPEGGSNVFTSETGTVECPNAFGTGHKYNTTPHELIPSGESTFTGNGAGGLCTGPFGLPTTLDENGCDGVAHLGETVGEDEYAVLNTAVCPPGKHPTITVFASQAKHLAGEPFCTQTLTENSEGYTGLTITDNTDGTLRVTGTISGIEIDSAGTFPCPNKTGVMAEQDVDVTISGDNEIGEPTEIALSHE